ncbi:MULTISPECIES: protein glxC [unclassified Pseudomonas]|uniref:GltB/FmdC/FwdC-like GXGXG domain-containing protein n=1 Tax=unclassified Pseudomonas TaxID=196821 RepID=UPI0037FABFD8
MKTIDLSSASVRELNQALHGDVQAREWRVSRPDGKHNLAVGINQAVSVDIDGHAGYYCAGMNQQASVTVHGNVGVGVGENMMSGLVRVKGSASQAAGATAHGGLLVIEGDAGARCGISMKGVDIVVGGSIGHMSCFMGQAGRLVVCGDAGDALGDSLYEVRIYVKGTVQSLGSDCIEKAMRAEHLQELQELLDTAGLEHKAADFKRYGSARQLYNFKVDNASAY